MKPRVRQNGLIDWLRLFAAIIIVLFHAHVPYFNFNVEAVGFFATTLVWFTLSSIDRGSFNLPNRLLRLSRPLIVWAAIQLLLKVAQAHVQNRSILSELAVWLPPIGTFSQLWFLLWAILVSTFLYIFRSGLTAPLGKYTSAFIHIAFFPISWLFLFNYSPVNSNQLISVFNLYAPSVLAGVLLWTSKCRVLTTIWITTSGLVLHWYGVQGSEQLWISLPVFSLALKLPHVGQKSSRIVAPLAMNIYLSHITVIAILNALGMRAYDTIMSASILFFSVIFAGLIMEIRYLKRILT